MLVLAVVVCADAFDKHCDELLLMCRKQSPGVSGAAAAATPDPAGAATNAIPTTTTAHTAAPTARISSTSAPLALAMR